MLRWWDSFDGYQTAQLAEMYIYSNSATVSPGNGRRGTNAMQFSTTTFGALAWTVVPDTHSFTGFACLPSTTDVANNAQILSFVQDSSFLFSIKMNTSAGASLCSSTAVMGSTPGGYFITGQYHQYEVDIFWDPSGSSGTVNFYRDSVLFWSLTGITFGAPAPTMAFLGSGVPLGFSGVYQAGYSPIGYFDDLYQCDSSGSYDNTGPIGDKKLVCIIPNGEGRVNQFSVVGEGSNWEAVSQDPPLYDSAYVTDTVVDHEDCYTLSTPATTFLTVRAVGVTVLARKDDAGDRTIAAGVGNGTTESYGTAFGLGAEYTYTKTAFDGINPNTSSPWEVADLSSLQGALKIVS